jgi:FkbM family methyltransferase
LIISIKKKLRGIKIIQVSYRGIKELFRIDPWFPLDRLQPKRNVTLIGNQYGSWYVDLKDIPKINPVIVSIGIGTDCQFEKYFYEKYKVDIYTFDPTQISEITLNKAGLSIKKHVANAVSDFTGTAYFIPVFLRGKPTSCFRLDSTSTNSEHQVEVISIQSIAIKINKKIDLIKIDAEGEEYKIIHAMVKNNILPSQILVEFHHRFSQYSIQNTIETIGLLRECGYFYIFKSDLGPEYTFIRL